MTGLALVGACLYPPWLVGWRLSKQRRQTVLLAPIWTAPLDVVHLAGDDTLSQMQAEWMTAQSDYSAAEVVWRRELTAWASRQSVREEDDVHKYLAEVTGRQMQVAERQMQRAKADPRPRHPTDPGAAPVLQPASLADKESDFARIEWSRLGLELAAILIVGSLLFVSLGCKRKSVPPITAPSSDSDC